MGGRFAIAQTSRKPRRLMCARSTMTPSSSHRRDEGAAPGRQALSSLAPRPYAGKPASFARKVQEAQVANAAPREAFEVVDVALERVCALDAEESAMQHRLRVPLRHRRRCAHSRMFCVRPSVSSRTSICSSMARARPRMRPRWVATRARRTAPRRPPSRMRGHVDVAEQRLLRQRRRRDAREGRSRASDPT